MRHGYLLCQQAKKVPSRNPFSESAETVAVASPYEKNFEHVSAPSQPPLAKDILPQTMLVIGRGRSTRSGISSNDHFITEISPAHEVATLFAK